MCPAKLHVLSFYLEGLFYAENLNLFYFVLHLAG